MNTNNKNQFFVLKGISMAPFIEPGNQVSMESKSSQQYRRGDIICFFQDPSTIFAHRLVTFATKNDKLHFVEKGDNVYGYSNIPAEKIIGKLLTVEKSKGTLYLNSSYWRTANYLLALIAYLQVLLLKLIPYSYHFSPKYKRIPHFALKLVFKIFLWFFMNLYWIISNRK